MSVRDVLVVTESFLSKDNFVLFRDLSVIPESLRKRNFVSLSDVSLPEEMFSIVNAPRVEEAVDIAERLWIEEIA